MAHPRLYNTFSVATSNHVEVLILVEAFSDDCMDAKRLVLGGACEYFEGVDEAMSVCRRADMIGTAWGARRLELKVELDVLEENRDLATAIMLASRNNKHFI